MWSLGLIFFILLGGYHPFYNKNTTKMFIRVAAGDWEFTHDVWDSISEKAKVLLSRDRLAHVIRQKFYDITKQYYGDRSKWGLRYTQKPVYLPLCTDCVWSCLLLMVPRNFLVCWLRDKGVSHVLKPPRAMVYIYSPWCAVLESDRPISCAKKLKKKKCASARTFGLIFPKRSTTQTMPY